MGLLPDRVHCIFIFFLTLYLSFAMINTITQSVAFLVLNRFNYQDYIFSSEFITTHKHNVENRQASESNQLGLQPSVHLSLTQPTATAEFEHSPFKGRYYSELIMISFLQDVNQAAGSGWQRHGLSGKVCQVSARFGWRPD